MSFHFLQCIFQHVHLTRGQTQSGMVSSVVECASLSVLYVLLLAVSSCHCMARHLPSAGSSHETMDSNDNRGSSLSMSNNTENVCMQAPAGGGVSGAAAIPAAATLGNDAVSSMEPVQRECWSIYNNPDAQARESGISIDEVNSIVSCPTSVCT